MTQRFDVWEPEENPRVISIIPNFVSWLETKYPKLDLRSSIPPAQVPGIIQEYLQEKKYSLDESEVLSKELTQWVTGDNAFDEEVKRRLGARGLIANKNTMRIDQDQSPLERYLIVPYHGLFLFLSVGNLTLFIETYWEDLEYLTADVLDIHYSVEDLERRVSGYRVISRITDIKILPQDIPALVIWRKVLAENIIIPLKTLSHDKIFALMQYIIGWLSEKQELSEVVDKARAFVERETNQNNSGISIERGEVYIKKDNINTSGGPYIAGNVSNAGGVNVFSSTTGTIAYTDNRIATGESTKLDELLAALRSQIAALPTTTPDQQRIKADAETSVQDIAQAIEEVKKDRTRKPKVNLIRGALGVFTTIGGPVLSNALLLLSQPVLGEAVNGLTTSLPDSSVTSKTE